MKPKHRKTVSNVMVTFTDPHPLVCLDLKLLASSQNAKGLGERPKNLNPWAISGV